MTIMYIYIYIYSFLFKCRQHVIDLLRPMPSTFLRRPEECPSRAASPRAARLGDEAAEAEQGELKGVLAAVHEH